MDEDGGEGVSAGTYLFFASKKDSQLCPFKYTKAATFDGNLVIWGDPEARGGVPCVLGPCDDGLCNWEGSHSLVLDRGARGGLPRCSRCP